MKKNHRHVILILLLAATIYGCSKSPEAGPVATGTSEQLYRLSEDLYASCSSDEYPFFSCKLNASFPFYEASTVSDEVEMSFCMVDDKPSVINPAYRGLFNQMVYENALFTSYMLTGISSSDFDTLTTDYLIQNFTPGDYAEALTPHMNCIFFRSANSNYGLIRVNSVVGYGTSANPLVVSFDVKYVDLAN